MELHQTPLNTKVLVSDSIALLSPLSYKGSLEKMLQYSTQYYSITEASAATTASAKHNQFSSKRFF